MASKKNNQGVGILVIAAIVLWFVFKSDNKSEKNTSMPQSGTSTAHVYTPPANQALDIGEPPPSTAK